MIVLAIPTIEERGDLWQETAKAWRFHTPEPLEIVPSWARGGWVAGLNEAWEKHPGADTFICGSDDMTPQEGWWEAIQPYLDSVIAPQVIDPRFTRFGPEISDGDETRMSSFPIMSGEAARKIFPLPPEGPQHYYADDWISDRAREHGVLTVAVPSCVILHSFDERARGAGHGSEDARMAYDKRVYRKYLTGMPNV